MITPLPAATTLPFTGTQWSITIAVKWDIVVTEVTMIMLSLKCWYKKTVMVAYEFSLPDGTERAGWLRGHFYHKLDSSVMAVYLPIQG